MKTIAKIVAVAVLAAGVSACTTAAKAPPKVFCPACGYEFQPPLSGF